MAKKLDKLEDLLKATETKQEFDIIEDLESLERLYGVLKARDYRKKLKAIVEKYKQNELTEIRAALIQKCLKQDVQAIKLYKELFAPVASDLQDDGLTDILTKTGEDLFSDEL